MINCKKAGQGVFSLSRTQPLHPPEKDGYGLDAARLARIAYCGTFVRNYPVTVTRKRHRKVDLTGDLFPQCANATAVW